MDVKEKGDPMNGVVHNTVYRMVKTFRLLIRKIPFGQSAASNSTNTLIYCFRIENFVLEFIMMIGEHNCVLHGTVFGGLERYRVWYDTCDCGWLSLILYFRDAWMHSSHRKIGTHGALNVKHFAIIVNVKCVFSFQFYVRMNTTFGKYVF